MASTIDDTHFQATSSALDALTDKSIQHSDPPTNHIHCPADQPAAHSFLQSIFPFHSMEEVEKTFHMGNYVIDRQTGQKTWEPMSVYVRVGMHALYYGSLQERALESHKVIEMLKAQSEKMGKSYDDPASVDHIQPFIDTFDLAGSMHEMVEPDPKRYKTFNDFFAREIREDARPIAEPEDPLVISSVADCRLTTYNTVDLACKYWIKGHGFTIAKLLGSDSLAQNFAGGSIAIHRLAPQDYHRWHCPADGVVESISEIPGAYYTVNPQAINESGTLDVFCENRRSVMIIKRKATGRSIAVVAVGAMLVGSIVYNPGIAVGADVHRGQCLGKFMYGGSTVITLYPEGEVVFDPDLVKNSSEDKCETLVRVGWRIGKGLAA